MKYSLPTLLVFGIINVFIFLTTPSFAETKTELNNQLNSLSTSANLRSKTSQANKSTLNHSSSFAEEQSLTFSKATDQSQNSNSGISKTSEVQAEVERNPISSRVFPCPSMSQ
jgi:competence protein ComGC